MDFPFSVLPKNTKRPKKTAIIREYDRCFDILLLLPTYF